MILLRDPYSMPCAKIITRPGSTRTSSLICALSQLSTSTACLPVIHKKTKVLSVWSVLLVSIRIHPYLECDDTRNYRRSFDCSVASPANLVRAANVVHGSSPSNRPRCAEDNPTRRAPSLSSSAEEKKIIILCHSTSNPPTCSTSSGVEIMPPQRVTLARGNVLLHRTTSSRSIWSAIARMAGLLTHIARTNSLNSCNSRFSSLIAKCWSLSSDFIWPIFCCWLWISPRSSREQLWSFNSSLGTTKPHPFSQGNGRLGLCSHWSKWPGKQSSLRIVVQP